MNKQLALSCLLGGTRLRHAWKASLVCGGLALGCGSPQEASVAEVGSHRITVSALLTYVEELPEGLRPQKTGDEARQHYLQSLIDGRLLLLEARGLCLDTTRAVRARVRDAVDARVRYLYRTREITSRIEISEEDVRSYFHAEGFDRERKASGIVVGSRAALDTVLGELQAGQPFAEVARAHSLDERSARQRGELGFVRREMAPRAHIPPEVFRSLPLGELSGPLRAGRNWHVVRFTEERAVDFDFCRDRVRTWLLEDLVNRRLRERLEQLRASFGARLDPAGLRELLSAYRRQDLSPLDLSQTPLYTYESGEILVGEAAVMLQERHIRSGFADSAQAAASLERLVLNPFLLQEAARRAGYYGEAEIRQRARKSEEDALLETLRKRLIAERLTVSEEEARQYYDTHPEVFVLEPAMWIEELLLPTEEEARQMRSRLEAGESFASLAGHSLRRRGRENEARFHVHSREKALYPKLFPAIAEHTGRELVGPIEVRGGYSVFRPLGYQEGGIEPYEAVRQRALALVRRIRENQGLQALLERLREKYAAQTRIYEHRLVEALPDSLVQGKKQVLNGEKSPSCGIENIVPYYSTLIS